jgi:hypothetical protein
VCRSARQRADCVVRALPQDDKGNDYVVMHQSDVLGKL